MRNGHIFWIEANEDLDVNVFNKVWEILNTTLYRATCRSLCNDTELEVLKKCIVTVYIATFGDKIGIRPSGGISQIIGDSLKRIQETLSIINQREFQRNTLDSKKPKIFYQAALKESTSTTNATVWTFYLKVIEPT